MDEKIAKSKENIEYESTRIQYCSYLFIGFGLVSMFMSLKEMKKVNPEALAPKHHVPSRMPPVPRITEKPVMNLVSSKNFVTANAVENILAAPKKVGVEVKDYLHKEDYGKVPTYLTKIKNDIQGEYDYIRRLQEEEERMMIESQQRVLTGEEQYALIEGLKAKWEKVNTDYQEIGRAHV